MTVIRISRMHGSSSILAGSIRRILLWPCASLQDMGSACCSRFSSGVRLQTGVFSENLGQGVDQLLVLAFAADRDAQVATRFQA